MTSDAAAARSDFRRVLGAEVVSNFGTMLSRLAIAWIAAIALDATPFEMGLLLVADVVAGAAGGVALGALVDRGAKRAVMVATDVARAAIFAALAMLAAGGALALWMLVAAAAANGLLTTGFELARSAWVARRIAADELPSRNAQLAAGTSLSETLAFALGGWIYQGLGAVFALAVDAASYALSAVFLRGVREGAPAARATMAPARTAPAWTLRALADDARAGLAALLVSARLRALAASGALLALATSLAGTSYMIFVARDLGFGPAAIGMIAATGGLGALLGAALAPRIGRRGGSERAMRLGLLLAAAGMACVPLAQDAAVAGIALLVAHQVVGDGGQTLRDVHDRTLRQTEVAPELLARVDAGIRTAGQLATLAGAVGGGALATWLGAREALFIAAFLVVLAALVVHARLVRP